MLLGQAVGQSGKVNGVMLLLLVVLLLKER